MYGLSRQSHYKYLKRRSGEIFKREFILYLAKEQRKILPRTGGVKLREMILPELRENGMSIGRDKFFDLLREENMLIIPKKKAYRTTDSKHGFKVYDNLIKEKVVTGIHQVYVSDITYIRTLEGFCFLALITDVYSRKIMGYDISDSMEMEGCLRALKMALKELPGQHQLIHHSDRGSQYCSLEYTKTLRSRSINISMAAKGNCYENALAERMNGILKQEFALDMTFKTKKEAIKACEEAVSLYNSKRLHRAIGLVTPNQKHAA